MFCILKKYLLHLSNSSEDDSSIKLSLTEYIDNALNMALYEVDFVCRIRCCKRRLHVIYINIKRMKRMNIKTNEDGNKY